MERIRIFVDFGSTFTKVCAFDMEREELAAWAKHPSTVDTDVTVGLEKALEELRKQIPFGEAEVRAACACSSASGGLRVACIGLTPELTTKAARLAAFGAGAKIVGTYSYRLSEADAAELEELAPDIVLLAGGIDGGDKKSIIHNARLLAGCGKGISTVIAAGNKSAADEIEEIFAGRGKNLIFSKNILPAFGTLDVDSVNETIRGVFLDRIVSAKGIDRATALIGRILVPTPVAVLQAAKLAADGAMGEEGIGDVLLVDVGGATTDVYSVCEGYPSITGVNMVGLLEPRVKRSVEGDLGLYHNLDTLADSAGDKDTEGRDSLLKANFSIPDSDATALRHVALTKTAVRTAVERHCGELQPLYTGSGIVYVQKGKDLSEVPAVIGLGGPIVFSPDTAEVLSGAVKRSGDDTKLLPRSPDFYLDSSYIMFALGLMAESEPVKALRIFKKYIRKL
ncbi:MAG: glutamate mutase L [Oscillospiraceae bacterium]|nr:glutamate mutase L [Oscillospiraceae bacterium]